MEKQKIETMHLYLNTPIIFFEAALEMLGGCCAVYFYFALHSKTFREKFVNQLIKNKRPNQFSNIQNCY